MGIELKEYFIYFEFSSLLVAIFCLFKYRETFFKVFVAYLFVQFAVEFLVRNYFEKDNMYSIYDILTFFEFNLISLLFYTLNTQRKSRNLIKYFTIGFNIIYALSFYYEILKNYTVVLGGIMASIFMFIYLKDLLSSNKIVNYKRDLSLFVTVIMLFYYLSTIPFLTWAISPKRVNWLRLPKLMGMLLMRSRESSSPLTSNNRLLLLPRS